MPLDHFIKRKFFLPVAMGITFSMLQEVSYPTSGTTAWGFGESISTGWTLPDWGFDRDLGSYRRRTSPPQTSGSLPHLLPVADESVLLSFEKGTISGRSP